MTLDKEDDRATLLQLMGRIAIGQVPREHRDEFLRLLQAIEAATVIEARRKKIERFRERREASAIP